MGLVRQIHQMVWGPWTLAVFLATGIFFSLKSGFFQVREFRFWWKETIGRLGEEREEKAGQRMKGTMGITQFQSVCTALAATAGTGNIAGVATALTAGGPGALFWMWVSAGIGMITAYAETFLGIKWRFRDQNGHQVCGPFAYMDRGLGVRGMGVLYGILCFFWSLGMGSMVQSKSVAETL